MIEYDEADYGYDPFEYNEVVSELENELWPEEEEEEEEEDEFPFDDDFDDDEEDEW